MRRCLWAAFSSQQTFATSAHGTFGTRREVNLESSAKERISDLRKGLQEGGYIEGTHYSLAVRSTEGDINRAPQLAREIGALTPRVIVVVGIGVDPTHRSFPELPLVFTAIAADPIALGWAQSYTHPGGMITGNVMNAVGGEETMTQKRIGLFKELVPTLTRLGMIGTTTNPLPVAEQDALRKVSAQFGFEFVHYGLKTLDDLSVTEVIVDCFAL